MEKRHKNDAAHTLLQQAALRVGGSPAFGAPLIIANEEHRFIIAEQLREIDIRPHGLLLEPMGRNTAPAAAIAALSLAEAGPEALMLLMPSDHTIEDGAAFLAAVERGPALGPANGAFAVARFVEKPDTATAERYVAAGDFFWNSGIFLFPAALYLSELERLRPDMLTACRAALAAARRDDDFTRLDKAAFAACPSDSIDYAVMEHTERAAMVPVAMGWSDLGSWDALWELADKDSDGNALVGNVIAEDSKNSYLRSESGLMAALGVEDLVVVATQDAVMIAPKSRAQDVRLLVARLIKENRGEADALPRVHRPWGSYETLHAGHRVQVKHILVKPGRKLSLQMHHHRAEHWVVVQGTAKIRRGNEDIMLTEDQSTYIPLGTPHRLENPGKIPLHVIEVQSGAYLDEDDIVRFDDDYGRN